MKRNRLLATICFVMGCIGFLSGNAFGGGVDNSSIGAKAFTMAGAFTGIADDASAIYYNPGGLVFVDEYDWDGQLYATFYPYSQMKHTANGIEDVSERGPILPGFFISRKYEKWAFGFGNYIPYAGGGAQFDNYQNTGYDIEGAQGFVALTPAVSYKISPRLSIGAGFSAYYGVLSSKIISPTQQTYPDPAVIESEYDGMSGYGVNLGGLYKPNDQWSVGIGIRSQVPIKMEGTTKIAGQKSDSEIEFTLPYYFTIGFGYKPNPDFTLGFDICHMLWGDMDKRTTTTNGTSQDSMTYYRNNWRIGLGAEYFIEDNLAIRAGLKYSQNATKDEGLNISDEQILLLIPSSCDVDLIIPSAGVAYDITERMEADFSILYAYGLERTDDEDRKYHQAHLYILAGLRFKFGSAGS